MPNLEFLQKFREQAERNAELKHTWYLSAAVALAACSAGSDVTELYQMLTVDLPTDQERMIQRRLKEAILKTSVLYGVPRSLQALLPLFDTLPDEKIDTLSPRWSSQNEPNVGDGRKDSAKRYFDTLWTAPDAQKMRDKLFKYQPDLYLLNLETIYALWISEDTILNPVETQMCNIAAIICSKAPQQAMWHTKGLLRHGGTKEQAMFVHDLAGEIAKAKGCATGDITPVSEIDF